MAIPSKDPVPNDVLREAFERSGLSAYQLAVAVNDTAAGASQRARRALGLVGYISRGRRYPPQRQLKPDTAVRYARVLGVDPVDLGL